MPLLLALLCVAVSAAAQEPSREAREFRFALSRASVEELDLLVNRNPDLVKVVTGGANQTAIFAAITSNRPEVVKWIVGRGADIEYRNSINETPLIYACFEKRDHAPVALELIALGANVNASINDSKRYREDCATPLDFAALRANTEVVKKLLRSGAKIEEGKYETPIHQAARNAAHDTRSAIAIIQILIEHGQDMNKPGGPHGLTPLHLAVMHGGPAMVEGLLKKFSRIDREARTGLGTPIESALDDFGMLNKDQIQERAAIIRLLISYGAKVTDEVTRKAEKLGNDDILNALKHKP